MADSKGNGRLAFIDVIETIAILFVLIYHGSLYSYDFINDGRPVYYARYYFNTILSAGVPLFFLANGYLLFSRGFDLKKHIFKTVRLIFITCFWGLAKVVILMLVRNQSLSATEIVRKVWNWENGWVNTMWFLGALICIYLFFPLLKTVYDNNKRIFVYFLATAGILTFGNTLINQLLTVGMVLFLHKNTLVQGINFFNIFNPFRGILGYTFIYFCLGGLIVMYKDKLASISNNKRVVLSTCALLISSILLFLLGLVCSMGQGSVWDCVWYGYDSVFTLINVVCIFLLCMDAPGKKVFELISVNTMGIYLMHDLFIHISQEYCRSVAWMSTLWFNIVYAILLMIVCIIISVIIKAIPFIKNII